MVFTMLARADVSSRPNLILWTKRPLISRANTIPEVMTIHEYTETRTKPPGVERAFRWYSPLLSMIAHGVPGIYGYNVEARDGRKVFTRRESFSGLRAAS
jgi:hypothetical protein